jgi:hypothetical protein
MLLILSPDYLSLQQLRYYVPNCVYPNPPCQLSLWEETGAPGENPRLFSQESVARFEPTISEVKGACSDDCYTLSTIDESNSWILQNSTQAMKKKKTLLQS